MGECDVMIDDTRGQFSDYLELDNTLSGTIRLARTVDYEKIQVKPIIMMMMMLILMKMLKIMMLMTVSLSL